MRLCAVLLAVAACGVEQVKIEPDAGASALNAPADARTGLPDDGFGFTCHSVYVPGQLVTPCTPSSGLAGWCDVGVCRRSCDNNGNCPHGQHRVLLVGNHCDCIPLQCDSSLPETFRYCIGRENG